MTPCKQQLQSLSSKCTRHAAQHIATRHPACVTQEADDEDPAPWVVKGGAFGGAFGAGIGALVDVHNNRKSIKELTATAEEHSAAAQRDHTSNATMGLLSELDKPAK